MRFGRRLELLKRCFSLLICVLSLAAFLGCSGNPPTTPAPAISEAEPMTAAPQPTTAAGGPRKYTGITFNIPAEWRELPDQQFVDSKYIVTTSKGELELTLTSMGGGIDANMSRWAGQIQAAPTDPAQFDKLEIDGLSSTLLDVRGQYNSNVATSNSGTKEDWRLVGIGIPVPNRDFFIRLVGPREGVAEFYEQFMAFVKAGDVAK